MMSLVQGQLGRDFDKKIVFASITVDPEHDTPEMLKLYAQMYGADVAGWNFLTGSPPVIADLTRRYGVFAAKDANGDVEHSFLTSIVDQRGILRVQYLGVRFDPEEFRRQWWLEGLVIKAGGKGVTVFTADGRVHVPALPTYPAFDTTGAGDAVAGGMLARWLSTGAQRGGLQDALVCGVACASLTIEAIGVRGIESATRELLDERMAEVWECMRRES